MSTRRIPTMQAAVFIIGWSRTFARRVGASFGGLCVIHFYSPPFEQLILSLI
jgi:hypothetical protein